MLTLLVNCYIIKSYQKEGMIYVMNNDDFLDYSEDFEENDYVNRDNEPIEYMTREGDSFYLNRQTEFCTLHKVDLEEPMPF